MVALSGNNLHMNDTNIDTHDPVFRTLQEMNTSWQHTHLLPHRTTARNNQNGYTQYKGNKKERKYEHYSHRDKTAVYNIAIS
jgi:hypothetical protein